MKIDYVVMSTDRNSLYDGFWEIVSRRWFQKIGIVPVLVIVGDEEFIRYESDAVFVGLKTVANIPSNIQAQISRLYATKLFSKKTILISDLDMCPISKDYYLKTVENLTDDSVFLYTSDHYGNPDSNTTFVNSRRCTMCYIVAMSETYDEILNLNRTFEEFVIDLMSYNLGWNTDEIYLGNMLNVFENKHPSRVQKNHRGLEPHSACAKARIDREYLYLFDEEKLKQDYYVDFHFPRPYNENKICIDDILNKINKYT